jgi:hypothetical protein
LGAFSKEIFRLAAPTLFRVNWRIEVLQDPKEESLSAGRPPHQGGRRQNKAYKEGHGMKSVGNELPEHLRPRGYECPAYGAPHTGLRV